MLRKTVLSLLASFLLIGCTPTFNSFFQKGKKEFDEKEYAMAIDNLNLALSHWKNSDGIDQKGKAFELMGQSYHALRKTDKAVESYKEAVRVSDKCFESAYQLGIIALASKDPQQALLDFRDALRMKNDDPFALIGLGNSYYEMGDYPNAKLMYERVLDTSSGVRDALKFLQIINEKNSQKRTPVKKLLKKKSSDNIQIKKVYAKKKQKPR